MVKGYRLAPAPQGLLYNFNALILSIFGCGPQVLDNSSLRLAYILCLRQLRLHGLDVAFEARYLDQQFVDIYLVHLLVFAGGSIIQFDPELEIFLLQVLDAQFKVFEVGIHYINPLSFSEQKSSPPSTR